MRQKKPQERKEEIRKAAIEVISKEGFHGATTDKIAEVAGVSVGTIYNYFDNKGEILSYIFKAEVEKLNQFFQNLSGKQVSTEERIYLFLEEYFNRMIENRQKAKLLLDESHRPSREVSAAIFNYVNSLRKCLKNFLMEGVKTGQVNAKMEIDIMAGMIIGAADSIVVKSFYSDGNINDLFARAPEDIFEMLRHGIFEGED